MTEESSQEKIAISEEDLWEQLLVKGLNRVMLRTEYSNIRESLLSEHFDILESRLLDVDLSIQIKTIENMWSSNPDVFSRDGFWKDFVVKALKNIEDSPVGNIRDHGAWYVLLNRIQDANDPIDWMKVLFRLSEATSQCGETPGFDVVLGWLIQADKKNLKKLLYRTETKKYPKHIKEKLYQKIIDFGLLDVKIARRIRSDTSGSLSSRVLAYLFEHRNLYKDDVFQNLVTQFTDTKHKWVARYIALNMPMHLVPFLMGIKDKMALEILEKRMTANDD